MRMREMVPCGMPVSRLMAACVQPSPISAASFSDVFMPLTIRTRIANVNTLSHRTMKNNDSIVPTPLRRFFFAHANIYAFSY